MVKKRLHQNEEVQKGLQKLISSDIVLQGIYRKHGFEYPILEMSPYESLIQGVIYQQLSYRSARAVLQRFLSTFGGRYPEPDELLSTQDDRLKSAGLSSRKIKYLEEIAYFAKKGKLDVERLNRLSDKEIMQELDRLRGIGPWTVHMLLIFILGRLDVFPYSDLGIRKALAANYKMKRLPTESEAESFSLRWKPYRTLAALLLWRSLDTSPWP